MTGGARLTTVLLAGVAMAAASGCTIGGGDARSPGYYNAQGPARVPPPPARRVPPPVANFTLALPPPPTLPPPSPQALAGGQPGGQGGQTTIPGVPFPIPGLPGQGSWTPPTLPGGFKLPWAGAAQAVQKGLFAAREGTCDEAIIGGRRFPVDCLTRQYAIIPWAAVALIPRWRTDRAKGFAGDAPMPQYVDHRKDGTEGPVFSQGQVGVCTAASLVSLLDHAISAQSGHQAHVSMLHVWSRYHRPVLRYAAEGNVGKVVTAESSWPFDERKACSWFDTCADGDCESFHVTCGLQPNPSEVSRADAASKWKIKAVVRLESNDTDTYKAALAKGQDIWLGTRVNRDFYNTKGVGGADAIVPDFDARAKRSGHAIALAGFKTQGNGTYFLIKNSWGKHWGSNGYAWIHEKTLFRNMHGHAYVVEVEPASGAAPSTPTQPNNPPATPSKPSAPSGPSNPKAPCPNGQLPDSFFGMCAPACSDGSPRAMGYCAQSSAKSGCPAGYANILGACVVQPAKKQGTDPVTGVAYRCGSGGCTYFLPPGAYGCGSIPYCQHTCPSPKYRLAYGPGGLVCTE